MSQAPVLNIPADILYTSSKPKLPDGSDHYDNQLAPTSGSGTYTAGDVFYFDLPSANFANFEDSLYIRAKLNWVNGGASGTVACNVIGTPLYTWISKLETIINSTTYESITNVGAVANMFVNSQLNVSQKAGSYNLGYNLANGYQSAAVGFGSAQSIPLSGPVPCCLSACNQLVPMFACPLVRLQFTVAQLVDVFSLGSTATATLPTSFTVSDIRLCYKSVSFGPVVQNYVQSMMPNIMIKTQVLQVMTQPVAQFTGQQDLTFNMRNQSIKSLFGLISNGSNCVNRLQDAIDITNGAGTYQFSINSKYYPSFPLNTSVNKAQFMSELKMAVSASSGHDIQAANMTNTFTEFNQLGSSTTTGAIMGKFYVGVNTEKHMSNSYMLSGVSTRDAPIIYSINSSGTTSSAGTVIMIVLADAMLEIDVVGKSARLSS